MIDNQSVNYKMINQVYTNKTQSICVTEIYLF
jgi:hypothetical protein